MPKIFIAADHAGFALKEALISFLQSLGYGVEDCGAYSHEEGDDYPDVVLPCAQNVAKQEGSFGIVIGASGQGEAIAANRVHGVRAAVYYGEAAKKQIDADGKELSLIQSERQHNNANILSLGARFIGEEEAKGVVKQFLETSFSGEERHKRRIEKLG